MKIKNRRIVLHRIHVSIGGDTLCVPILVTPIQLARLKETTEGKKLFLSHRYCHTGGNFWVIRTKDSLQSIPNPEQALSAPRDPLVDLLTEDLLEPLRED